MKPNDTNQPGIYHLNNQAEIPVAQYVEHDWAEFICQAVNSHTALKAQNAELVDGLEEAYRILMTQHPNETRNRAVSVIKQALAKIDKDGSE